jgi:hypothetical protein
MLAGGMGPQRFVTISQRPKVFNNFKLGSFRRIAGPAGYLSEMKTYRPEVDKRMSREDEPT